ncbi:MAG: hypothetical protein JO256_02965 [Alphaproteobacteria bacterium]|nr:hypothetical protein [Alphaproteobacteria bacterium]
MPSCRHDCDETRAKRHEKTPAPEWREPPGRLGEYVRRVKRLAALQAASTPEEA